MIDINENRFTQERFDIFSTDFGPKSTTTDSRSITKIFFAKGFPTFVIPFQHLIGKQFTASRL